MVGDAQVVVNGLGNADDLDVQLLLPKIGGELLHGVHGIVSADVEKRTDLAALQAVHDLLVHGIVLLPVRQFIPAGAQHRGGRLPEQFHIFVSENHGLEVDEVVVDDSLHAVDGTKNRINGGFFQGLPKYAHQ